MKLVIYQTSDIHGFIYPSNYVENKPLGFLKIASFILQDEKKYDFSLKIDCGDLIQGSPMTHYLSKQNLTQNPITTALNFANFDAYVLGNHEFNYGLDYLYTAYKPIENNLINANIIGLDIQSKPYKIFDFDGFKVACIGLTTSYIPNWEKQSNIQGLVFEDPVKMYRKYEKEMLDNSDFIVVCYHGGFEKSVDNNMTVTEALTMENQASELLENFSSINIILSGHQHRSFITQVGKVICSQPFNNGVNFTKIIIDTETKSSSFELVNTKDTNVPIDANLDNIFTSTEEHLQKYLDTPIGHFSEDIVISNLFDARLNGHPFIQFLHQVQLDISNADFSALSIFDTAIGFKENVTVRDVLINYPFTNTLRVLEISGNNLKLAIEKAATYFVIENGNISINNEFLTPKAQHYNYDIFAGLDYNIDITKEFGNRVTYMRHNGTDIDLKKNYSIVLNSYRARNTSIYPSYADSHILKEIDIDMSEIIIDYIRSHPTIIIDTNSNYSVSYL